MKSILLSHFKNELPENFEKYFIHLLDEKGMDIVSEMVSHMVSKDSESAKEHIERRHLFIEESDMVETALNTGQPQGAFAFTYKNPMSFEDLADCILDALYENANIIASQYADGIGNFNLNISSEYKNPIGYGINSNFDLVKSNKLEVVLKESDDLFSPIGLRIDTCYPVISTQSKDIIKSKEALIDEYQISENDMSRYKFKQDKRVHFANTKNQQNFEKLKSLEDLEIKKTFGR